MNCLCLVWLQGHRLFLFNPRLWFLFLCRWWEFQLRAVSSTPLVGSVWAQETPTVVGVFSTMCKCCTLTQAQHSTSLWYTLDMHLILLSNKYFWKQFAANLPRVEDKSLSCIHIHRFFETMKIGHNVMFVLCTHLHRKEISIYISRKITFFMDALKW